MTFVIEPADKKFESHHCPQSALKSHHKLLEKVTVHCRMVCA